MHLLLGIPDGSMDTIVVGIALFDLGRWGGLCHSNDRAALGVATALAHVQFQFRDGAAEGVAVHGQRAGGLALVALVLLEDVHDETLLKFAHSLGIENAARVHLCD